MPNITALLKRDDSTSNFSGDTSCTSDDFLVEKIGTILLRVRKVVPMVQYSSTWRKVVCRFEDNLPVLHLLIIKSCAVKCNSKFHLFPVLVFIMWQSWTSFLKRWNRTGYLVNIDLTIGSLLSFLWFLSVKFNFWITRQKRDTMPTALSLNNRCRTGRVDCAGETPPVNQSVNFELLFLVLSRAQRIWQTTTTTYNRLPIFASPTEFIKEQVTLDCKYIITIIIEECHRRPYYSLSWVGMNHCLK